MPNRLLYTKGRPASMSTDTEGDLIASIRRGVSQLLHLGASHATRESVQPRYAALLEQKQIRNETYCCTEAEMRSDRIGQALDAGRRWAEKQFEDGIDITPDSTWKAAQAQFDHLGSRELFWRAALDAALLKGAVKDDANRP